LHDDLHQNLGEYWLEKPTSEAEEQLLATVEILSQAPVPATVLRAEIGASARQEKLLTTVATTAELMQNHRLKDGTTIVTSPLCAFEQPDQLVPLFESHPADQVRDAFGRMRRQPGLPALMDGSDPVVETMIRLGLVPAPTVVGADKRQRAFVVLPYGLDPSYLTTKKQILDRALTIIACVRCGEVSGGVTPIRMPDRLLRRLTDKGGNYTLRPHSSTARQYAPLIRIGVIRTVPQGDLQAAQLVATADNLEAVELARILLRRQGEGIPERGNERAAASLLFTSGDYLAPIETIGLARRNGPQMSPGELAELWEKMMGWRIG
jgi:hypothetical protein